MELNLVIGRHYLSISPETGDSFVSTTPGDFLSFLLCECQCWLKKLASWRASVLPLLPCCYSFLPSFSRRKGSLTKDLCCFQNLSSEYVNHIHTFTVGEPKESYPKWHREVTKSSTTLKAMQPKKSWLCPNLLENNCRTPPDILCLVIETPHNLVCIASC